MTSLHCGVQCYVMSVFYFIDRIESVPLDYCLHQLNMSDCHAKPTPVFSYYRPGSRCEIEIWRGCPTFNKFDNEYDCSQSCIFTLQQTGEEQNLANVQEPMPLDESSNAVITECDAKLDTYKCSDISSMVYTHVNGTCVNSTWHGCPTRNKFDDKATCLTVCLNKTITDWKQELEELPDKLVENIDQILGDVIAKDDRLPQKQVFSGPETEEVEKEKESEDARNVIDTSEIEETSEKEKIEEDTSEEEKSEKNESKTEKSEKAVVAVTETVTEKTEEDANEEEKIEKKESEKEKSEKEEVEVTETVTKPPDSGEVSEVLLTRTQVNRTDSEEEIE